MFCKKLFSNFKKQNKIKSCIDYKQMKFDSK